MGEGAVAPRTPRRPPRDSPELNGFWRFLALWCMPILQGWLRPRVRGAENVPRTGAVVITPNHFSDLDPVVIGTALWYSGRVPRFLAKASLWKVPALRTLLRQTGQIPVRRDVHATDALSAAGALVARGDAVIVYPEGTLTREPDLWPMRGKSGAVRLAIAAGAPIVPSAHWGDQAIMERWAKRIRFFARKRIEVVFGPPVDLSRWRDLPKPLTSAQLDEATDEVMAAITTLLEGLRGEIAPLERWNPADHGQTEFGRP